MWGNVSCGEMLKNKEPVVMEKLKEYVGVITKELKTEPAEQVASSLHNKIDNWFSQAVKEGSKRGKYIICKKGCSHCCHSEILVSEIEFELIAKFVKDFSVKFDKDLLEKQQLPMEKFRQLDWEDKKCVFLKNNTCSIYPVRPIVCRIHNSSDTTAELCKKIHPHGSEKNPVNNEMQLIEGHLLMIALFQIDNEGMETYNDNLLHIKTFSK